MVKSMTGYGRAVETVNGREFTVEIRSVNNRYLDCTVKLPRTLSFAEDAVKQAVKGTISRGKVDVFVSQRAEGVPDVTVSLNRDVGVLKSESVSASVVEAGTLTTPQSEEENGATAAAN